MSQYWLTYDYKHTIWWKMEICQLYTDQYESSNIVRVWVI